MAIHITQNEAGNGVIIGETGDGVEYGDAIQYFSESKIKVMAMLYREMLRSRNSFWTSLIPNQFFIEKGREAWKRIENEISATAIPDNFTALLNANSKAEQERLLRNASWTTNQYAALLFRSKDMGYTFSSYLSEKLPADIKEQEMPKLLRVDGDKVLKRGQTPYSDGRLKGIIHQRKVIVARILDRDNEWHCFFQTYKSIRGEESWRGGLPHMHYISDKWGISRADLVQQIRNGQHPSTKIHIALIKENDGK